MVVNENKNKIEVLDKEEGKSGEKTVTEQELVKEATELLQKKNQEKIQQCWVEIQRVLRKYNCVFEIGMLISPQGNKAILNIVSRLKEGQTQ